MEQNQSRGNWEPKDQEQDQEQRAKTLVELTIDDYKKIKEDIPELNADQVLQLLKIVPH